MPGGYIEQMMLIRSVVRVKSLVLVTIVSAVVALPAVVVNPLPAAAAECGDQVVVLGAPGSGQRGTGLNGLGIEVSHAYSQLVTRLRSLGITKVRSQTVDYKAAAASVLTQLPGGPNEYFNGLNDGVQNARAQLGQIQRGFDASGTMCSGARIVLMGLSQGAMVMHRVLEGLAPGGKWPNAGLLDRVAGALLIGDGDKMPADVNLVHTFPASTYLSRGIAQDSLLRGQSGASGKAFPDVVKGKVFNVCVNGDVVCDFGVSSAFFNLKPVWAAVVASGIGIHTTAYRTNDYGAVAALANRVAPIVKAGSPTTTTPPTSTPSGPNGKPAGDCGGRVEASPTATACAIVRQNREIESDYSNLSVLQKGTVEGGNGQADVPAESVSALASIGIITTKRRRADGIVEVVFGGTPTGEPGIYPYNVDFGTSLRLTYYFQIVPRTTPDA